ncbi:MULTISPECIES: hypothetical protein [Streptomyces]|uniref:hypothetical protein n=1 Tax=Streptomyces TaxID=1883 RepID=UPI00345C123E
MIITSQQAPQDQNNGTRDRSRLPVIKGRQGEPTQQDHPVAAFGLTLAEPHFGLMPQGITRLDEIFTRIHET